MMLAMLYATYIMQDDIKFSKVPPALRPQVKAILDKEGLGELATLD